MKTVPIDMPCPCGSGHTYGQCCRPFHRGDAEAPTAEALMRSRYTAFVAGDVDYLLRTWHPETRPAGLELDSALAWTGLQILRTRRGGESDRAGTVEFRATYREGGQEHAQQEKSTFVCEDGRWVYRDALSQS
ncbi:YchJ family protein [Arthrobacter sp. NPDC055138]